MAGKVFLSCGMHLPEERDAAKRVSELLSLTLAALGGVGERVFHAMPDMLGNFDTVSAGPRHERNLMCPYFAPYRRDGIAEGQDRFWIPSGGSWLELS